MAGRLTVLHLIDTGGPGGAETVFRDLVTRLDPTRWRPVPVVPVVDWLHRALSDEGMNPRVMSPASSWSPSFIARLRRLIVEEGVRLVHAHFLRSAVYGSLATAFSPIPVISTFHGEPDLPDDSLVLSLKQRLITRSRNRIVFVSNVLRDRLRDRFDVPDRISRIVHNGVDPAPRATTGGERSELGAEEGTFLVGAVGNVRPAKDYGTLLRAIGMLRDRGVPVRCVVLGDTRNELMDELGSLRGELGLDGVAEFVGFRRDARRYLSAMDVLASSSSSEGFSLTIVEALLAGTPVVATRSGGPEEILRHEETGLLVEASNPALLADALERAYQRPDEMQRMADSGRADVSDRFSMRRMLHEYEALYSEVA